MMLQIPEFLTAEECAETVKIAEHGRFRDGLVSLEGGTHNDKNNEQLAPSANQRARLNEMMKEAVQRSFTFRAFAQPQRIHAPMLSRYTEGMHYARHLDEPIFEAGEVMRTDLSLTVFLEEPETYDGGALIIATEFGEVDCKLPAGAAVVYTTTYFHEVEKVTRGRRLALVTWAQSRVRDPVKRAALCDIAMANQELTAVAPQSEISQRLRRTHAILTKLWSEV